MARLIQRSRFLVATVTEIWTRCATTAAAATNHNEWASAKPYSNIPGPKPLPIPKIGNIWRFLRFGPYYKLEFTELTEKLTEQYGSMVRISGILRRDFVIVTDPADAEKIFRTEGRWPIRRGIDSIDYYRRHIRNDVFGDFLGVATTQGEEWQKNRSRINQPMMKPQNIKSYHEPIQSIATDFVQRIRDLRDENNELPEDFQREINKWALESIAMAALDSRLGCLDPNSSQDSEGQRMIKATIEVFDTVYRLDILPSLWKVIPTPDFKRFTAHFDEITSITLKHIDGKLKEINERSTDDSEGASILEIFLKGENGKQVAITMAIDMMMAGIDTTSNSSAFTMYYLATHPDEQEKLYQELKKIMPNKDDDLPKDYLNKLPYLKASVKESLRLSPIATTIPRSAGADIVLKGYKIPKGTDLLVANYQMVRDPKQFKNPLKWSPERWLKNERNESGNSIEAKDAHPFTYLPFGFGSRMCVGRRLAELEMHTLLAKMFRNFRVSYKYGELKTESKMILRPTIPLKFQCDERPN